MRIAGLNKLLVLTCVAGLASGCSKETEQRMNATYDENFRASCVSSSVKAGAPQTFATQVCECALGEINKRYSATEKLTISADTAKPIMAACINKAVK